jgi:CubicO group peptidase (beta-lactamase class C family)
MNAGVRKVLIAGLFVVLAGYRANADVVFPGAEWHHMPAQEAGWSPAALAVAHERANALHSTALMVIAHGVVVVDWGDTVKRTELASVRKSLLSALIGIAVANKKIDLNSTLARLGIDDNPPSLTDIEKQATVRMLLQARSGIYHSALYETKEMAAARPQRGSHAPGTFWYYNNWDFNALGTIYEHATGLGIYDALEQQIARPIGMQDYRPEDGQYFTGPDSIHRAYPIRMSARDLARFALLYLRGGIWAGRQVVPADWVRESTRPYSNARYGRGYGYLWWTADPADASGSGEGLGLPAGTFFALGAGGQTAFVIPKADLVVVNRVDRDLHLPEPTVKESAEVVRLILHAGGFAP